MIPLPYVEAACPMGTASETPRAFSKPMLLREWPRTVGSGMVEFGNEAVTVPLEISSRRHLCARRSATIEFDFEGSVSP